MHTTNERGRVWRARCRDSRDKRFSLRDGKHTSNKVVENEGNIYKAEVEVSLTGERRRHDIQSRGRRGGDEEERLISKGPRVSFRDATVISRMSSPTARSEAVLVEMVGRTRRARGAIEVVTATASPDARLASLWRRLHRAWVSVMIKRGFAHFPIPSVLGRVFFGGIRQRVIQGKRKGKKPRYGFCPPSVSPIAGSRVSPVYTCLRRRQQPVKPTVTLGTWSPVRSHVKPGAA